MKANSCKASDHDGAMNVTLPSKIAAGNRQVAGPGGLESHIKRSDRSVIHRESGSKKTPPRTKTQSERDLPPDYLDEGIAGTSSSTYAAASEQNQSEDSNRARIEP